VTTTRSSAARRALVALVSAVALLCTALAVEPAAAQAPDPEAPRPLPTFLLMAVVPLDEPATVATVTCDPPGGTHPLPDVACRDIANAGGNFAGLSGDPYSGACDPNEPPWPGYGMAFGWWRGQLIVFSQRFETKCTMANEPGRIFYALVGELWVPDDEESVPPGA
jgi:hypothetical protein